MPIDDQRSNLVRTLRGMVETLDAPHADVAARIQGIVDQLESAPPGALPDRLLRRVRRLRQGTMGSLSDVVFAELRGGRWVADQELTERWTRLSRRFAEDVTRLPAAGPSDLFLVADRVRECWLFEPPFTAPPPWHVDVFPPVCLDGEATTGEVSLRPTSGGSIPEDGMEVSILWESQGSERMLGSGSVFTSRSTAEAAAGQR